MLWLKLIFSCPVTINNDSIIGAGSVTNKRRQKEIH